MPYECVLDVALRGFLAEAEKVEEVRVLQRFDGKLSVRCGEMTLEVGDGDPCRRWSWFLSQRGPRPAVLDDLGRIPLTLAVCRYLGQECDEVEPWQLVSRLLTNCASGTFLSEEAHVLQV
jgi:hypothetical protein